MTVYGLGGCGKSALAIEFAYRALVTHARLLFWVPAISQESFELAYREIGVRLGVPGIGDDNADVKRLVQETLDSDRGNHWLMIVDNADDHEVLLSTTNSDSKPVRLSDYLPRSDRGSILFTTRSRKAAVALTQSSVLGLKDMAKAEARQLLALRLTEQTLLDDQAAFDELLEALSYLPLAIVQAAAFMNNNDMSVSDYVALFRQTGAESELFNENFYDPSRYEGLERTIAKTWHISFDQIRKQDSLAADYLSFMACIDRINIPQSLLPSGASVVQQTKALGTLAGYAFIAERLQKGQGPDRGRFFDMHRLVHMASTCWLDAHGGRAAWVDAVVARLEELVPYGGHENKDMFTAYLPHAVHVAGLHNAVDEAASARLLNRVGLCQASLGQHLAAEITHRQCLSIRTKLLGPKHPDTLTSMNEVAVALSCQGDYAGAEKIHREEFELRREVSGEKHPHTLASMNNIAYAVSNQGQYAEAERIHRETLKLKKEILGEKHLDTLIGINNVAYSLSQQGQYAKAEKKYRKSLELSMEVLGEKHPHTLISMNNVAAALSNQGQYAEAEVMHRKTLENSKEVLGERHSETLTSMNNVAASLTNQGQYAKAEEMHRQTLELRREVLGQKHPDTLTSMNNVAVALSNQGDYVTSVKMHRETLELKKEVLGEKHPHTLITIRNLEIALSD